MFEVTEIIADFSYLCKLPTELLDKILSYLPLKELMKCRQICLRWKLVVDRITSSDDMWKRCCRRDFDNYYRIARVKAKPELTWNNIYKSLFLWPRLTLAIERIDEFAGASRVSEEIRNIVLRNGILGVHRKSAIEYYDSDSLKMTMRDPIRGDYARYTENDSVIVIQSYHHHLFVIKKPVSNLMPQHNITFDDVKTFLLTDTDLYFVKLNDEIYCVHDIRNNVISSQFINQAHSQDGLLSLGYSNGCLNLLTYQRNIYTIANNKNMVFKQSLNMEQNILSHLHKYNLLENLDWRIYFQWMFVLNHTVPEGPMRNIIVIRPYGDVFFVGTQYGALYIFYKPYSNNELDIFKKQPIKVFNFMERSDIPVLTNCPILQIDVMETEMGHTVFVAMPKKVVILKYTYRFMHPEP